MCLCTWSISFNIQLKKLKQNYYSLYNYFNSVYHYKRVEDVILSTHTIASVETESIIITQTMPVILYLQ